MSNFKSGLKTLAGDAAGKSFLSLFDQMIVSATTFFTGVLVARYCEPDQLGAYHLALSVILLMGGLQAELVTAPFTVFSQQRSGSRLDSYSGSILIHQAHCLVGATILLWLLFRATVADLTPAALGYVMPVLVVAGPAFLTKEFCRLYASARMRFDTILLADTCALIIQLGMLFWIAVAIGLTVSNVYWIMAAAAATTSGIWWLAARPRLRFRRAEILEDWRLNWSFGRWTLVSFLVNNCTPYLMTWFVAALSSAAEAGVLGACSSLVGLAGMFVIAITRVLTPKSAAAFAHDGISGLRRVCKKAVAIFTVGVGSFTLLVFIIGDWLGRFVFGPDFGQVGFLVGLIASGLLVNCLAIVAGTAFLAMNRPRANLPADITTTVVILGLSLLLIGRLGALGAAWATLIGNIAGTLVRWATLVKYWRAAQPPYRDGDHE